MSINETECDDRMISLITMYLIKIRRRRMKANTEIAFKWEQIASHYSYAAVKIDLTVAD